MSHEQTADAARWYLIYTNPQQENRASQNLLAGGIETLAPLMKATRFRPFTGEPFAVVKPLFPRYIFARFELASTYHKVRFTRGVHSLVSFGEGPAVVDDAIIEFIRSRVGADGLVRINDGLKSGDPVVVRDGPLKGVTGIFEREMQDPERVRVLLEAVNYQAHVTIDRGLLRKAG